MVNPYLWPFDWHWYDVLLVLAGAALFFAGVAVSRWLRAEWKVQAIQREIDSIPRLRRAALSEPPKDRDW